MKTRVTSLQSPFASEKGSALMTAIIFSTVSMVTVASFLKLTNHELRLSNSTFYMNQSLNMAEAGLDEAMHLLNFENDNGWTVTGNDARFSADDIPLGRGATGGFDVLVEDWLGDPVVTAEGRVTAGTGFTSSKQLRITLRPRSYFANGITSRCRITFSGGNSHVESYRSSEGVVGSAQYVRRDRAAVATTFFEQRALDIGNGFIWGYAFTGGSDVRVGPHGTVKGADSPLLPLVDPKRVARDFSAIFPRALPPPSRTLPEPAVSIPAIEAWIAANNIPRTVHHYLDSSNIGRSTYRTNYGNISTTTYLGIPGALFPMVVEMESLNLNGPNLHIVGPVILVVRSSGSITVGGGGRLIVGFDQQNRENASLLLYTAGNVTFQGNGGMENRTRIPNNLAIFGMGAEVDECSRSQTFGLGGNASWEALVYAPNADITLNGGGNSGYMAGAVVGMSVDINGGSRFHYDEDTESFLKGFGFAMSSWRELPQIERISFH